jgi:hypothetical protein
MPTAGSLRAEERAESSVHGQFLGRWVSTNPRTTALAEATFSAGGDGTLLRVSGVGEGGSLIDWGTTAAALFVDGPGQVMPTKVRASYNFGFMEVLLHGWVKQGVLVFAVFSRFRDDPGRSNHFDREFFCRTSPDPAASDL